MVLHIITTTILFSAVIILWKLKANSRKRKRELAANENKSKANIESETKYVSKGLGFMFQLGLLSFLSSRKNPDCKDTILDKLYAKYGSPTSQNSKSTFIIKYLRTTLVYPKDYKIIKAFLCSEACSDRFPKNIVEYYSRGRGRGIMFNSGEEAKELRCYTMKSLGKLGFGKNHSMTDILNEQLIEMLERFENQIISTDNKIQVQNLFTNSAISIVWGVIGGSKFSHNDPDLHLLYTNVEILTNLNLFAVFLTEYFPQRILTYFDIFGLGYKELFRALDTLDVYFQNFIEEKKLRIIATDPVDFVDHFLLEIEKHRSNDQLNKIYCKYQLIYVLIDLFVTGMDTTSKYMESAFVFMVLNPDVQVKVQKEIDAIIGVDVPNYNTHRKRMSFTEATIMEIHRMANTIAAMPRMNKNNIVLDGQNFEKGTWIFANLFFFRMDETYWGDPKTFRPERFLDSENNLIADKVSHVMPFGTGSRGCLGESVATSSIFVFITGILQRFNVVQNDANEFVGLTKGFVAISHPEPFHVSLIHRNNIM